MHFIVKRQNKKEIIIKYILSTFVKTVKYIYTADSYFSKLVHLLNLLLEIYYQYLLWVFCGDVRTYWINLFWGASKFSPKNLRTADLNTTEYDRSESHFKIFKYSIVEGHTLHKGAISVSLIYITAPFRSVIQELYFSSGYNFVFGYLNTLPFIVST